MAASSDQPGWGWAAGPSGFRSVVRVSSTRVGVAGTYRPVVDGGDCGPVKYPVTSTTRWPPDCVNTSMPAADTGTTIWLAIVWPAPALLRLDVPGRVAPAGHAVQ